MLNSYNWQQPQSVSLWHCCIQYCINTLRLREKYKPFCRRHFKTNFGLRKFPHLIQINRNFYPMVHLKYQCIGSDSGLVPNRQQAIIWTNDGCVHRRTYVLLSLNELTPILTSTSTMCSIRRLAIRPHEVYTACSLGCMNDIPCSHFVMCLYKHIQWIRCHRITRYWWNRLKTIQMGKYSRCFLD